MNNSIPVKVIAERLGNTPEMIHTVYVHLLQEMEAQTVSVFSQSLKENGASLKLNPTPTSLLTLPSLKSFLLAIYSLYSLSFLMCRRLVLLQLGQSPLH